MKKKNRTVPFIIRERIFRNCVSTLSLLLMIILLVIFLFPGYQVRSETKEAVPAFQVKLPDGLYLYKPNFRKDVFSPLVLVENGKLIDPYVLANNIGFQEFLKKYLIGKDFNVYDGREMIGRLSNLKLSAVSIKNMCTSKEFLPNIEGNGVYNGRPFPVENVDKSILLSSNRVFGSTRIVITPQSFQVSKKSGIFTVTEADKKEMKESVQKNLVPAAMEHINKILEKEGGKAFREGNSRLDVADAFDLDRNGKKDLVGIYYLSAETSKGFWPVDILFVLWNMEKIEKIGFKDRSPAFMLGGVIDIDQDGIQELIIGTWITSIHEDGGDGRQIDILRHSPNGWESVYRTKWICDPWGFYYK